MTTAELIDRLGVLPPDTEVLLCGDIAYSDVEEIAVEIMDFHVQKTKPLLPFMEPIHYRSWQPSPTGKRTVVLS